MKFRHRISAWLLGAAALFAAILPGCAHAATQTSRVRAIPTDGIVRKVELAALKKSGDIAIYRGKSDGIAYEWTFVGPDIQTPSDVNLKVTFHPADETAVRQQAGGDIFIYQTAAQAALPGNPSLSITLGKSLADGSYRLYTWFGDHAADAGGAQVTAGVAALSPPVMGEAYLAKAPDPTASSAASAVSAASAASASSSAASSVSHSRTVASVTSSAPASPPASSASPDASTQADPNAINVKLTIRCDTAVSKVSDRTVVPADGVILSVTSVTMHQGDTVFDLLTKVGQEKNISVIHKGSSTYHTVYITSIHNLAEKNADCGPLSGWMYSVNGTVSDNGVSQQVLKNGDDVKFLYTCNLGKDIK